MAAKKTTKSTPVSPAKKSTKAAKAEPVNSKKTTSQSSLEVNVAQLDDPSFLAFVQREESAIYQQASEQLAAWQNDARLGRRLRPVVTRLTEID